jgi:hypothetical protein
MRTLGFALLSVVSCFAEASMVNEQRVGTVTVSHVSTADRFVVVARSTDCSVMAIRVSVRLYNPGTDQFKTETQVKPVTGCAGTPISFSFDDSHSDIRNFFIDTLSLRETHTVQRIN